MSFFTELKRRNVFRVGAAYLVVAWLLIQVVDTVGDMLSMPDNFGRGVLILLAIGFPVVLIVSWVFELTTKGIQTQATADDAGLKTSGGKLNAVIMGGLALALVFVVLDSYVLVDESSPSVNAQSAVSGAEQSNNADGILAAQGNGPVSDQAPVLSIAVLPFTNLSSDPEQDYFADGLSEELLNKLAQVKDLQVAARTSSFYYKGRNEDLRVIGQELGVAHLLEGSVRKAGNSVRITAQLIRAEDGFHLWSDSFDRDLNDIFLIQDEIATAITRALSITISAGEFSQPGMTTNIEAFEEYLQASKYFGDFNSASMPLAIDHIEKAVSIDPKFSMAWLQMSRMYRLSPVLLPPDQVIGYAERSVEARERAIELTPELPVLLAEQGRVLQVANKFSEAEQIYLAIFEETGSSNITALNNYGGLLMQLGRIKDALPYLQQARRLETFSAESAWQLAQTYAALGRLDDAMAEADRGLTLDAMEQFLLGTKMLIAMQTPGNQEAVLRLAQSIQPPPEPEFIKAIQLWVDNDIPGAMIILEKEVSDSSNAVGTRNIFASLAVAMGDPQPYLRRAREIGLSRNVWFPSFHDLRQTPEFKALIREQGFLDYWRSTGNWPDMCKPLEGSDDFECE